MVVEDDWVPARIDGEKADFPKKKKWQKIVVVLEAIFGKALSFQARSANDNAF